MIYHSLHRNCAQLQEPTNPLWRTKASYEPFGLGCQFGVHPGPWCVHWEDISILFNWVNPWLAYKRVLTDLIASPIPNKPKELWVRKVWYNSVQYLCLCMRTVAHKWVVESVFTLLLWADFLSPCSFIMTWRYSNWFMRSDIFIVYTLFITQHSHITLFLKIWQYSTVYLELRRIWWWLSESLMWKIHGHT